MVGINSIGSLGISARPNARSPIFKSVPGQPRPGGLSPRPNAKAPLFHMAAPAALTPNESSIVQFWKGAKAPKKLARGGPSVRSAADMGRNGDTMLAHINPREASLLKSIGGAGTRNPKTGLLEFYSDSANEHERATTGHNMADHSRPGDSGGSSGTHGGSSQSTAQKSPPPQAGGVVSADKMIEDKYTSTPSERVPTDRDYWNAVSHLGQRSNDYMDRGNTGLENFGNFLAGLASIGEMDPTKQALGASINNPNASWGIDPLGVAASIGGMATGLPIGSLYKGLKHVTGYSGPMIAFDGNQYGNYGFNSSPIGQGMGVVSDRNFNAAKSAYDSGSWFGGGGAGGSPTSLGNDVRRGGLTSLGQLASTGTLGQSANPSSAPKAATPTPPAYDPNDPNSPPPGTPEGQRWITPYPGDITKYGEGPGWLFWHPQPFPNTPVTTAATGGTIRGAGDGQADKIPALLSDGEHVIDAQTVAAFGRGSNDAGHKVIEKMKQDVRKRAGYKNPKKAPLMSIGSMAT